jgi:NitT/TauT family transport system substrate-binding protein
MSFFTSARANAMNRHVSLFLLMGLFFLAMTTGCGDRNPPDGGKVTVRLGYFPNVTHAQALIGIQRGDFERALGEDVTLRTTPFNAGPSVIEALFAGHLDLAYIGPSPTINGFLRTEGREVRVIAGAAENGIVIIGNKARGIERLDQLAGRKIATPQIANTQDISAKHYVTNVLGSRLGRGTGETEIIPVANPDLQNLFEKNQLDAAWAPEPWAASLELAGLVVIIAEEKDLWEEGRFTLTSVIARAAFLERHPEIVERFLGAHVEITRFIQQSEPSDVVPIVNAQIAAVTGKRLNEQVLQLALSRCDFRSEIDPVPFGRFFQKGRDLGFYSQPNLDLNRLLAPSHLERALARLNQAKSPE